MSERDGNNPKQWGKAGAREVIADTLECLEGVAGNTALRWADTIIKELENDGFKIMNAQEFAKALAKGRAFKDRVERQANMLQEMKLARLDALEDEGWDFSQPSGERKEPR